MNLSIGIVGLPNVGKSTLFNALLSRQVAEASNYPFTTIEPNVGVVEVPDPRLQKLATVVKSEKIIPSVVKFVDIAGIIAGAHKGEGLGNKFLSHIREVSLILHVLRDFDDEDVVRTGKTPQDDFETIITELMLADLQTLEKQQQPKNSKEKTDLLRWSGIEKLKNALSTGKQAYAAGLTDEEQELTRDLFLLTSKQAIHVVNVDESRYAEYEKIEQQYRSQFGWEQVIAISAKIESELSEMNAEEKIEYLASYGLTQSGLERLIVKAFDCLGLTAFLTAGEKEVRSWTILKGSKAPQAAGVIHTDFEKQFIRAQVASFTDFVNAGGWKVLKEQGKVRMEGKEYVMQDDDVVEFMINKN